MPLSKKNTVHSEWLNAASGYFYTVSKKIISCKTKFQKLELVDTPQFGRVLYVAPGYDRAIDARLGEFYDDIYGISHAAFDVPERLPGLAAFEGVPCRS